ncbi:YbbR domain-containing protein [Marininema mesophilum]|uniref:YbbR domain-containing protein n=1 Tax=Marininema mesophilum TaxID=1048340 RepID=A0A1H3APZ9_9BACL|nr:CdaR family protein [Marininema mesophilum]SDX31830.1 YbbR domain-containing protein [Marininema mesophilum]
MDKWLQNTNVIKLIALALAIMLWMSVNDASFSNLKEEKDRSIINNVTLQALYNKDRFEVTQMPKTVNLVLQGDTDTLKMTNPGQYKAYVDLRKMGPGQHFANVKVEGFQGLDAKAQPNKVKVVLEEKQQKEMSVQVDVIGKPSGQYKVGTPVVKPSKVLVRGSKSALNRVTAVKAVINADGAQETISRSASLQVYGKNGEIDGLKVNPRVVDVKLPIAGPNAVVPLKVEIGKDPPDGYAVKSMTVGTKQVTVYGPKSYVEGLEVYPGPKPDLSKAKSDRTFELPIPLSGDAVKVAPEVTDITVQIVKGKTKKIKGVPISMSGKESGMAKLEGDIDQMDFELLGAPSLLKKVEKADVEASIDLSNLSAGEHRVPVQVNLPLYVRLNGDEKPSVKVRIER